ncbi:ABC transporter permease subunit [Luteipulveratus sp. YIM 133132]|uniref:ABC transporter permease subunit n=1 Tax=Luteipulveratus flavus TaxID=3031728 RepID=A0ABT6C6C7_9MICO|nr:MULTISPECIES: ABC transporter permease subunit [unclassified Luteipulveratus]MDE9366449.1 ABC transporter permease subunit [Luteipulveratus sp. YIM 133132]MDF8264276.1 ABC transporter permease subunit [Luteipulveratus sp. YIM 133296]
MNRLVRVELRRMVARRATWVVLGLCAVLACLVVYGSHQSTRYLTPANRAQAAQGFDQSHADWVAHHDEWTKDCLKNAPPEAKADPSACAMPEPTLENFLGGSSLRQVVRESVSGTTGAVMFLAFLLGATFVAAEFSSGTMSTWLTFEPRRLRVFLSKVQAPVVGGVAVAAVMALICGVGVWWVARGLGLTAEASTAEQAAVVWTWVRLLAVGAFAGALGAAVGFVVRNTAACLGIAVAYGVVAELIVAGFLGPARRWLISTNLRAVVDHGTAYLTDRCTPDPQQQGILSCTSVEHHVSLGSGAAYLVVVCLAVVAISAWSYQRRDVG